MKKQPRTDTLARLFGVLSDQTRLKLLTTLQQEKECNVTELCRRLRAAQPTVSHHLGLLRIHGLVRARRDGKQVYYSVDPANYKRACQAARALLSPLGKRS